MASASHTAAQFEQMTTAPVPRLIARLAVPTIISMLVTSIYNMADTFFVGRLGTSATGAVGVVFSIMAIIQAVGFTLGMGGGSLISRLLGQQAQQAANEVSSTAFYSALALGLIMTLAGLGFLDPLVRALGATDTIAPYARDYAQYILLGAPVMTASFVMNNLLRAQGRASQAMVGLTLGGLLNIGLDPLLIFTFNMGIAGAAIATVASQCVSFLILLSFFLRGKSLVTLSFRSLSRRAGVYFSILKTGFPSLCRQGLASLASVALNVGAAPYGDAAVAAMGVVGRISMFIVSAVLGFGQGFQPVVGYNYGARQYGRVRQAFFFTVKVGTLVLAALAIVGYLFAPSIIALFRRDDPQVIAIGAYAFRAQCLALPLQALIIIANMLLQVTGHAASATLTSSARQGLFFLPLIVILPAFMGLTGVQIAQPLADVAAFICCIPLLARFFRRLPEDVLLAQGDMSAIPSTNTSSQESSRQL